MRELEEKRKNELMEQRMAEQALKEAQRRDSLARQESLLKAEGLKKEQDKIKRQQEAKKWVLPSLSRLLIFMLLNFKGKKNYAQLKWNVKLKPEKFKRKRSSKRRQKGTWRRNEQRIIGDKKKVGKWNYKDLNN